MKVPHNNNNNKNESQIVQTHHHYWVTALFMVLGFGVLAVAAFWIKKCKQEEKEGKEPDVIGHDRFCQERPSRSSRRKKKPPRRTQSVAEFSSVNLTTAASKRHAFRTRSQSSEQKDSKEAAAPQRSDSLAKMIFSKGSRSSNIARHEYSALKRTDSGSERHQRLAEPQVYDGTYLMCRRFLATNDRYELRSQLDNIGSRSDKRWFTVQDITLGAERLLSLVTLPPKCPIKPSDVTRETVITLFRSLQHPYIHPVLDIEFWDSQVALITPLNNAGSLRDLIYSCSWNEEWDRKYTGRGEGLPLWQVQRLGRQILEALLFLRDRSFPPFHHLHSGNVILQNGVARLAGLENPLLGLPFRSSCAPDTLAFGHLLFEMTAGYELPTPPSPAHLQIELERVPRVADVLRFIFQDAQQPPSLEELLCCDLFRGVELRELRGIKVTQCRCSPEILELLDVVRQSVLPAVARRNVARIVEGRQLEDILEEESEENDAESFVKVSR